MFFAVFLVVLLLYIIAGALAFVLWQRKRFRRSEIKGAAQNRTEFHPDIPKIANGWLTFNGESEELKPIVRREYIALSKVERGFALACIKFADPTFGQDVKGPIVDEIFKAELEANQGDLDLAKAAIKENCSGLLSVYNWTVSMLTRGFASRATERVTRSANGKPWQTLRSSLIVLTWFSAILFFFVDVLKDVSVTQFLISNWDEEITSYGEKTKVKDNVFNIAWCVVTITSPLVVYIYANWKRKSSILNGGKKRHWIQWLFPIHSATLSNMMIQIEILRTERKIREMLSRSISTDDVDPVDPLGLELHHLAYLEQCHKEALSHWHRMNMVETMVERVPQAMLAPLLSTFDGILRDQEQSIRDSIGVWATTYGFLFLVYYPMVSAVFSFPKFWNAKSFPEFPSIPGRALQVRHFY